VLIAGLTGVPAPVDGAQSASDARQASAQALFRQSASGAAAAMFRRQFRDILLDGFTTPHA